MKFQITNSKSQTNSKFKTPNSKPFCWTPAGGLPVGLLLVIRIWILFVIWCLEFGIFCRVLPRTHRLRKKKDFQTVAQKGKGLGEEFLILKSLKNILDIARIGFVVSREVSNKATIRNRVKRRLREAVRVNLSKIKSGYDLVFFARKKIKEKDFWEIKEAVERLLEKAKLFENRK